MTARLLTVAGSDSSGGAGIQADIKTATALGVYSASAITNITAQNTLGVEEILPLPAETVARQMSAVLRDIGADCIKTGMLGSTEIIIAVAETIAADAPDAPLVVDPVMRAGTGAALMDEDVVATLKERLIVRATLITPNVPEAEMLSGRRISSPEDMMEAARLLAEAGPAVLLTGGHLPGDDMVDVLATGDKAVVLKAARLPGGGWHGTGCTLASAAACGLAQGMALENAIERARAYVRQAIESAPGLGGGDGPLGHTRDGKPKRP